MKDANVSRAVEKLQAYYALKPDAPVVQKEFGWYSMGRWTREGHLRVEGDPESFWDFSQVRELFSLDEEAIYTIGGLGGCVAPFVPEFEEKLLEDRGNHELIQDTAGRKVEVFRERRNGYMPRYVDHPVKDAASWRERCLWRLDPTTPERYAGLERILREAEEARAAGKLVRQYLVGGYMYLRSLMGPENLLYAFYDDPELVHECMRAWLAVTDAWTAAIQKRLDIDELQFDEDICYKTGSLISPDMIREFLFPYYTRLLENVRARSRGTSPYRPEGGVIAHLASDGNLFGVIDLYRSIGFSVFAPMEAAAGMDVVEVRKRWPDIRINGGFDKRILAAGREAIDREIERIMPFMIGHGGYYPTCDHGVPEEVAFEDYLYYRRRMAEFG